MTTLLFLASDLAAILLAFAAAWVLRFELQLLGRLPHQPELGNYLELLPFLLVAWPVVFYFHGLYQMRRGRSRVDEVLTLVLAMLSATVLLYVLIAWYRPEVPRQTGSGFDYFTYSRGFLTLFPVLSTLFLSGSRLALRSMLLRRRLRGEGLQRILVLGAGTLGRELTQKIQAHGELGFEVVGFLDDDPGKAGRRFESVPVLGKTDRLEPVIAERRVDQVFIALPVSAHKKILRLLQQIGRQCVDVKLVPDILQYATLKATLEDVDGLPVINLSQVPLQGWNSLVKRLMDIVLSAGTLLAVVPFFPWVALAIWWEDRGPIFYHQERMGLDGRSFMIWKFRSMRVNAEASTGPVWATRDDPRRTRVGGFLRRWSVDELPQLWNVLKGDMSIVGPRPERPTFVHEFKHKIPQYMLRHRVKAGITGWAQVHGWRGDTSIKKRIQYDLYYIENWSLSLDLKILWMTLRHGLRTNAY
jgi:Undecaprenyl-phosphate glucose phosphotransferase